jgi:ribonuclease J
MTFNVNKYRDELLFVPLGGAGEIGMNFNLYQYKGKWLIVDCGAGFAEDYMPGIDLVVPDINFILQYKKDLLGIVLTHSHEDHFGAVQYLWEALDCPIYATPFTAAFLKNRLKDNDIKYSNKIFEIAQGGSKKIGPFDIEMIPLCHSAPEMQALVIKTDLGNIFHTGDWKFDEDPILGEVNDESLLKKYGDEGILAIIGDSTNVFKNDSSGSEGKLKASLEQIIADATGMIVVTTFASNVARLDGLLSIAQRFNKKVVLTGRSLKRILAASYDCNYLVKYSHLIIDERDIVRYPRDTVMVIATGCQGEPLAALTKMSNRTHKKMKLVENDTVIFSSKIIPGNDKKIFRVFNNLVKMRVEVLTEKDHFVHVSGHPSKPELIRLYKLLRPKVLIPVHGEHIHMHEHAKIARSIGIEEVLEVENGDVVKLAPKRAKKIDKVEAEELGIYGNYFLSSKSSIMKQRRRLQSDGIFIVYLTLSKNNKLVTNPVLFAPGYLDEREDKDLFYYIREEIADLLRNGMQSSKKMGEIENIQNHVKSRVKGILKTEVGRVPDIKVIAQRI